MIEIIFNLGSLHFVLQVIPQLIARIDHSRPLVSKLIHQLLTDVGKQHPQELIYRLTVASKSSGKAAAKTTGGASASSRPKKKSRFDQSLFIKFSKPVHSELLFVYSMSLSAWVSLTYLFLPFSILTFLSHTVTFYVREEAVGIGQPDSVAKYGIVESVGNGRSDILEDDYGIAVKAES